MKLKTHLSIAFLSFSTLLLVSVFGFKNTKLNIASPKVDVTLSTGLSTQNGCDASNSWPCDMTPTSEGRPMGAGDSSAKISLNTEGKIEINFLKYNLKPALKLQLDQEVYPLSYNYTIENQNLIEELGFSANSIVLRAGSYLVGDYEGYYTVAFDYFENQ